MLQSMQAGAVRHGGRPARSQVTPVKGRGDGTLAVQVRDVDLRQGTLG